MKKICVINQKGGVAKTTTAISLAAGLALKGKSVLLLDLDPQGHVATYFPLEEDKKDMFEFLTNGAEVEECIYHIGKNFDAVISSSEMANAESILVKNPLGATTLRKKMAGVNSYDYVIIDCPPTTGLLAENAMLFSDEAIIPTSLDPLGVDSLKKMIARIQKLNLEAEHELKITKILPTIYDKRNKICNTMLQEITNEYYGLVSDPIRINSKLREAPGAKKSIFTYAPSSRGAQDYGKLVDSVINDEQHL